MNTTNTISILSRANTAGLDAMTAGLKRHEGVLRSVLGTAAGAGKAAYSATANIAGLAGAAVVAFTGASINAAAQFGEQLAVINTIARTTPEALGAIGDGIRELAAKTGEPLASLTKGYYDLLSAGISVADAQGVLAAATTLGIGGLATTAESVDLLTTAINAWGMKASDATRISDSFAVAIDKGKVTADQIAGSLFNVASTAANAGIDIAEVAAAYAAMSAAGIPAAQLTVAMRSAILSLQNPTEALAEAQATLGVNFAQIAREKGLHEAYRLLLKYSEDSGISLLKLTGRVEAQQYAFAIAGETADEFDQALKATQAGLEGNGHAALQAAQRMNTLPRAMGQLRASVADLMIEWGNAFLPGLISGVQAVTGIVQAITSWMKVNRDLVRSWAPVISIVSSIFALRTGMQGVMLMFGRFLPIMGGMGRGFSILGTSLTALAFPVGLLVLGWNVLTRAVAGNWAGLGRYAQAVAHVSKVIREMIGIVGSVGTTLGQVFRAITSGDFDSIGAIWGKGMDRVGIRVGFLQRSLGRLGDMVRKPLLEAFRLVSNFMQSRFGVSLYEVTAALMPLVRAVGDFIAAGVRLAEIVLPSIARALSWLARTLAPVAFLIGVTMVRGLTAVMNVAATFLEWLNGTTQAAGIAREVLGDLFLALLAFYGLYRVVTTLQAIGTWIANVAGAARDAVMTVIDFGRALGRIASKTVDLAVAGASSAVEAVQAVADGIRRLTGKTVSLAVDGAQAVGATVSTLVENIGKFAGTHTATLKVNGAQSATRLIDGLIDKLSGLSGKTGEIKLTISEGINPTAIVNGLLQGIGLGIATKGGPIIAGAWAKLLPRLAPLMAFLPWSAVALAIIAALGLAIIAPDVVGTLGGWIAGALGTALLLAASAVLVPLSFAATIVGNIIEALEPIPGQIADWIRARFAEIDIDLLGFLNLDELVKPFTDVLDKITVLWDAFWADELDLGAIGGALLDLGAALVMLPADIVIAIGSWLLARLIDAGAWVLERGGDALAWLGEWVGSIPGRVAEWWGGIQWPELSLDFLPDIDIGAWWDTIVANFAGGVADFGELWAGLTGEGSPIGGFITWLGTDVGPAFAAFELWWDELWGRVGAMVSDAWNAIMRSVGDAVTSILTALLFLEEAMPGEDSDFAQSLRDMIEAADAWGVTTKNVVTDVGTKVGTEFSTMAGKPGALAASLDAAVLPTGEAAKRLAGAVKSRLTWDAGSGGGSIVSTWVTGMQTTWRAIAFKVQGITDTVGSWFGRSMPTAGPLANVHSGGASIIMAWVDGIMSQRDAAVAQVRTLAFDIQSAMSGVLPTTTLMPVTAGDGTIMSHGAISRGMGAGRDTELLAELVNATLVQNEALSRMAAEDPKAAGPLAARSLLEELKQMTPARRPGS